MQVVGHVQNECLFGLAKVLGSVFGRCDFSRLILYGNCINLDNRLKRLVNVFFGLGLPLDDEERPVKYEVQRENLRVMRKPPSIRGLFFSLTQVCFELHVFELILCLDLRQIFFDKTFACYSWHTDSSLPGHLNLQNHQLIIILLHVFWVLWPDHWLHIEQVDQSDRIP